MPWEPQVYERFADERSRPFLDLLDCARRMLDGREIRQVVDLGCGTGSLTATLADSWPAARVTGIDQSPEMLRSAQDLVSDGQWGNRLRFESGDVRDWRGDGPVDLLVTNAVLQWVPGHAELLPTWVQSLSAGGVLALQVPGNGAAPSHVLLRETVADGPWAERLAPLVRGGPGGAEAIHRPEEYAEILYGAGCEHVDAWETTYVHVLDRAGQNGDDAVLTWVSGTALRPFLAALEDEDERRTFVDAYRLRLRSAYPRQAWGTPFRFRRVFAVARASR